MYKAAGFNNKWRKSLPTSKCQLVRLRRTNQFIMIFTSPSVSAICISDKHECTYRGNFEGLKNVFIQLVRRCQPVCRLTALSSLWSEQCLPRARVCVLPSMPHPPVLQPCRLLCECSQHTFPLSLPGSSTCIGSLLPTSQSSGHVCVPTLYKHLS